MAGQGYIATIADFANAGDLALELFKKDAVVPVLLEILKQSENIEAVLLDGFSGKDVIKEHLEREKIELEQLIASLEEKIRELNDDPNTFMWGKPSFLADMEDALGDAHKKVEDLDSALALGGVVESNEVQSSNSVTAISGTLANLNDPLLPEFEQAISDITATIKEAIAQLDACMAAQSCGDSTLADGILPLDELSGEEGSDKGLMGPAFGLMPLADGAGEAGAQNAQVLNAGLAQMDEQSSSPQEAARSVVEKLIPSIDQLDARLGGLFDDIVVNGGDAFESLTSTAKGIIDEFANNVLGNLFAKYLTKNRPNSICLGY